MSGLKLFSSNRLEILAEKLAETFGKPLASPLEPEIIVVQSKGMEKWVSLQLAQQHGICANCRFPFPNAFVHEVFRNVVPDLPERSPFDPKIMTWRIMKLLPSCITRPGFENLKSYLRGIGENLKRFQLSERIADTFDQYLLFRPKMIFRWERGQEDHWQAELWRELIKEAGKRHRAALGKDFLEAIKKPSVRLKGLPDRISVFGISALPRFHMQLLAGISRFSQVNLFLMNPCKEYWGDILSEWETKKTTVRESVQDLSVQELHLEKGNSLLASMGTLGKDFFDLTTEFPCEEFGSFKDPGEDNLLSCIQSDILSLHDREQKSNRKKVIEQSDSSIQIHSCHSPMREIEVLHDQFLQMFEKDPNLNPKDVLVMTPDIETYSPYIHAVFDIPTDDPRYIPFSIADQSMRKESEVIDTFLKILDLWDSRFSVTQVLSILESPAVQRRFGLYESNLELIQRWVTDTRIRWGIDGQSRSKIGLPSFPENTWKAGLERLLLGYAIPGQEENMFSGVLPYDYVEGADTLVLGGFIEFADKLFTYATSLSQPRGLDEWSNSLIRLLEGFFLSDETTEKEMQIIRHTLNDLAAMSTSKGADFNEKIDINVIKWHIRHSLEGEGFGFGFLTRGITFCTMLPMRSIPFKVICLVGMNSDAYPRESKPLGFDFMAKYPEPGDRSRRNDDRYLFLETMLSARECLYISYVGQSIQDNSLIQPSVLISELIDYIEQGFEIKGINILELIFSRHHLQAFSPKYFKKDKRLFSYSEENLQAAQCILKTRKTPESFISQGLSRPEEEWKTIDLGDLTNFFSNPSRFLLNKRLNVYLRKKTSIMEEKEAFEIKGLEKYLLEENLVKRTLAGHNPKDFLSLTRATGLLPHGTVGECLFEGLSQSVESFVEKTASYMEGSILESLEIDLRISGFRLTGRIDAIYPKRLIQYRYSRIKAKDRLKIWIHHLALNAAIAHNYPRTSLLAGLETKGSSEPEWAALEYSPVENSQEILEKLIEKYWAGLIRPLHFFPQSSLEYAQHLLKDGNSIDALLKARNKWRGDDFNWGECEDDYYQLCFRNTDPLDSEFQDISEEVFVTLLRNEKRIG